MWCKISKLENIKPQKGYIKNISTTAISCLIFKHEKKKTSIENLRVQTVFLIMNSSGSKHVE